MKKVKRFYKQAAAFEIAPGIWQVQLDGKPAKTPARNPLTVPTAPLAEAIAGEWNAQTPDIRPETMKLTRLANTAIDRVSADRRATISLIMEIAAADVLCFRASRPDQLVERQGQCWDPLLEWASEQYGVNLATVCDITPIQQPNDDLGTLESFIVRFDDFTLTGVSAAASLLGSAVLALAMLERRVQAQEAFETAELDAGYQAEIWGQDPEIAARNRMKLSELIEIERFLSLSGAL